MRRILVIGIPGAGKSTFARALAERTGLPIIHLDREHWQPGWVATKREAWRMKVVEMAARDRWIMDGNYGSSLDLRLPRADTVCWFDYPRVTCLRRALWRSAKSHGQVRADMGPGCPEQFDPEFVRYIWRFKDRERPATARALSEHGSHLAPVIFRRDSDAAAFLASLAFPSPSAGPLCPSSRPAAACPIPPARCTNWSPTWNGIRNFCRSARR